MVRNTAVGLPPKGCGDLTDNFPMFFYGVSICSYLHRINKCLFNAVEDDYSDKQNYQHKDKGISQP